MRVVQYSRDEQYRRRCAEERQRQQGQQRGEKGIDRMKAGEVERVEPWRCVVYRVNAP